MQNKGRFCMDMHMDCVGINQTVEACPGPEVVCPGE